jgi:3-oxoacyl-[acyl-carrier protein] reductase
MMAGQRTALVTGASEGIGLAIATSLAQAGHRVVLAARRREPLDTAVTTIAATGVDAANLTSVEIDVGSADAIGSGLARIAGWAPAIDILVNNAGLVIGPKPFGPETEAAVRRGLEVNLFGALLLTEHLLPGMRARGFGRIVNIASTAGMHGPPTLIPYAVSKGALIAFSRTLAVEVAESGVTVNSISPGPVATANYRASKGAAAIARRGSSIPGNRLAEPGDVGVLAAFLCSDGAAHLTGQNIALDGGEDAAGPYVGMVIQQRASAAQG